MRRAMHCITKDLSLIHISVVEHITEEPKEGEEGEPKQKAKIVRRPVSISDTHPLWTKNPSPKCPIISSSVVLSLYFSRNFVAPEMCIRDSDPTFPFLS